MKAGDLDGFDYKNPQKNHWRKNLWNDVADRLHVPAREALVVYLSGEQDLDRALSRRRGFHDANLIAVEQDSRKVATLRSRHVTTINGDIFEVAASFTRPVDVILIDLCRGVHRWDSGRLALLSMIHPMFSSSVIAVNWLRGRDPSHSEMRTLWQKEGLATKHRGKLVLHELRHLLVEAMLGNIQIGSHRMCLAPALPMEELAGFGTPEFEDKLYRCQARATSLIHERMKPLGLSYRSHAAHQTFDTLILSGLPRLDVSGDIWRRLLAYPAFQRKRAEVAAALAIRTRKLRGDLPLTH